MSGKIELHTFDAEETDVAIDMLTVFFEELKQSFFPFVESCIKLIALRMNMWLRMRRMLLKKKQKLKNIYTFRLLNAYVLYSRLIKNLSWLSKKLFVIKYYTKYFD